jgi:DMSO/TMAO reductase YedYZ molybdopterin-dependent catalytic subunit
VDGKPGALHFERSLSLDQAHESQALLAYAMNGEVLPIQHGFPVRLIVPSWYAVASVKWLTDIEVSDQPSDLYFQAQRYMYEWPDGGAREPVTQQLVRALITEPTPHTTVSRGELTVRGVAWSGTAPIDRVENQAGHGQPDQPRWNRLGYGCNAVQAVSLQVVEKMMDEEA